MPTLRTLLPRDICPKQLSTTSLSSAGVQSPTSVVFSTYATYVVMSFMMMVMVFMLLPAAQVSAERINEVLDRQANITEGSQTKADEVGTVEFKNVSFVYPEAQEEAISDISFRIEKGKPSLSSAQRGVVKQHSFH